MRKNCETSGRNLLLYLLITRVIKLTVVVVEGYQCCQLLAYAAADGENIYHKEKSKVY
jgi:uncharacterized protein YcgI (DUF1989 family)